MRLLRSAAGMAIVGMLHSVVTVVTAFLVHHPLPASCSFVRLNSRVRQPRPLLVLFASSGSSSSGSIVHQRQHDNDSSLTLFTGLNSTVAEKKQNGSEISPHYRQDRREKHELLPLPTVADPAGLARLLEQRHQARCEDDYIQVSVVDTALKKQYGVVVYDHPPIWSRVVALSVLPPPAAVLRQQAQKQAAVMQRAFGATGHPFQHVGDSRVDADSWYCDVTMSDIHAMLSRYTQCRLNNEEEAAAVLLELSIHGVRVCDTTLQWTTDPTYNFASCEAAAENDGLADFLGRLRQKSRENITTASMLQYTKDPRSEPFAGYDKEVILRTQQRVEQLVLTRSAAILRGEVSLTESIALELYHSYKVGVNDRTKTWSLGCLFCVDSAAWQPPPAQQYGKDDHEVESNTLDSKGKMFPSTLLFGDKVRDFDSTVRYRPSLHSRPVPRRTQQRVEELVQERIHKREEAKYLEADAIRRELWRTYNVGVNDRLQQYSVGGVYDKRSDAEP